MTQGLINAQLGNYRIQRLLGRGGFAEVYLAEHIFLKTQAAIKLLHTNQQDTQDFLREARLLASLKHPHIVSILEFDLYEGRPFLVMEYMPYGTLRQRYPRGSRLSLAPIIAALQQMASALYYLHGRGLAHGDVKPENMLLGAGDRLHLSDFGIAILANKEQEQALVGTIEYMAPEQLQHQLQPASDQYALGITAYEWLAGTPPFTGSYIEVATQHALVDPLPLREHIPHLPAEVDSVILRALAKEPEQRFASIRDFADALVNAYPATVPTPIHEPLPVTLATPMREPLPATQEVSYPPFPQTERSLHPATPAPTHSRRALLLAGGAGVAALAGAGGFFWWRSTQQGARASVSPSPASSPSVPQRPVSKQGTTHFIYTRQTAAFINTLAWSPDSRRVATASNFSVDNPSTPRIQAAYSIHVWDALTGAHPVIYLGHKDAIYAVAWSPNGKYIASGGAGNPPLQVWEASTGKQVASFTHDNTITQIYWQGPDQLLCASSDLYVTLWKPFAPTNWRHIFNGNLIDGARECVVSPNGQYVVVPDSLGGAYRVSDMQPLGNNDFLPLNAPDFFNYWAPNGRVLATTPYERPPEVWDAVTGKVITQFTRDYKVASLGWSSDGKSIASYGNAGGIYIWNASNGRAIYLYAPHTQYITSIAWSPNGQLIASGGSQGNTEVWQAV